MTFSKLIPEIGIMEGRLLPKYLGRYQAHPVGYWQQEFPLAKNLGLSSIEFILDFNDFESNPLMSEYGIQELQKVVSENGVEVKSVCADYFMEAPLHSADQQIAAESMRVLNRLVNGANALGITDIVIPCVDQSSVKGSKADRDRLIAALSAFLESNKDLDIHLALETDLGPQEFGELLSALPFHQISVNYDSGNSASLGFDVKEEFDVYGDKITDLHIKDRIYQGGSVVLGTGNVNWDLFFEQLMRINYKGITIMQAYRDDEGLQIFRNQLEWLKNKLNQIS